MSANSRADLPEKIQSILDIEVESMVEQYNPYGIILVGSYANGRPGAHSDLDIYIIVEDQQWRERGNYFVDDVEIEYFINPVKQIRTYFEQEKRSRPHTVHMLATGIVLYSRDEVVDQLISEARQYLENYPVLDGFELELYRYIVDDAHKDLLNLKENKDSLAYQLTAFRLLEKVIEVVCLHNQTYVGKTTLLMEQLTQLDTHLSEMIQTLLENRFDFYNLEKLIHYVETEILSGKRTDVWSLRSSLTVD